MHPLKKKFFPTLNLPFWMSLLLLSILLVGKAVAEPSSIILQSTTSTQNSGLFDEILPQFTRDTGITVHVVAVGTGQALKNGRNGDGDVLLVHARPDEEKFVADGFGAYRFDVMYNDFVLIGPAGDPAQVSGSKTILAALQKIAATKSVFISRGDDSGTNKKERLLWRAANIAAHASSGSWYREAGAGMGATLNLAAAINAYTLSDRATWIAFQNKSGLQILAEGDGQLFNQYGVILVNPKKHTHINVVAAEKFINWLKGKEGQEAIARFKIADQQLFFPNAKSSQ